MSNEEMPGVPLGRTLLGQPSQRPCRRPGTRAPGDPDKVEDWTAAAIESGIRCGRVGRWMSVACVDHRCYMERSRCRRVAARRGSECFQGSGSFYRVALGCSVAHARRVQMRPALAHVALKWRRAGRLSFHQVGSKRCGSSSSPLFVLSGGALQSSGAPARRAHVCSRGYQADETCSRTACDPEPPARRLKCRL